MAKIWVVDDDHNLANLTKLVLVERGHTVDVFPDALKVIEKGMKEAPHLIIMDVLLPQVSGAQAVKILKEIATLKDVPIVFVTGLISSTEKDIEKKGITVGEHSYKTIGKPYKINDLLNTVEGYVGKAVK